jgi:hypothetical protein
MSGESIEDVIDHAKDFIDLARTVGRRFPKAERRKVDQHTRWVARIEPEDVVGIQFFTIGGTVYAAPYAEVKTSLETTCVYHVQIAEHCPLRGEVVWEAAGAVLQPDVLHGVMQKLLSLAPNWSEESRDSSR